jgi:hypothetical protein
MERDAFREALNEAYNAGLLAQDEAPSIARGFAEGVLAYKARLNAQPRRWQWGDGPVKCFTCDNMVPEPSVCESCYPRQAKPDPLRPSTRELIATVRACLPDCDDWDGGARDALTELEKRIGGERG